ACNRATDEYAHSLDLASEPTHITDTADDTNIDVDANREYIISNGIDYHLVRSGHRSGTLDLAQAKLDWTDSLRIARSDRDHDIATDEGSSTETDAPEEIGNLN
ncbi:MAG: hypothetical protein KKD01_20055, partial [Proteobacteria bacterium]|nr:hypothetical protein [Pseudomonadota bacterium]